MKVFVFFLLAIFALVARAQLILDEDDPETQVLIKIMMKAINEHEHADYKFKTIVYSLGETDTFKIMLKVTGEHGVVKNCALNLRDNGHGLFKPEHIDCVHANE